MQPKLICPKFSHENFPLKLNCLVACLDWVGGFLLIGIDMNNFECWNLLLFSISAWEVLHTNHLSLVCPPELLAWRVWKATPLLLTLLQRNNFVQVFCSTKVKTCLAHISSISEHDFWVVKKTEKLFHIFFLVKSRICCLISFTLSRTESA